MPLQYPKRNGYLYSLKSTSVQEGGEVFNGLLSVKYTPKVDGRAMVHANKSRAYGRVRGNFEVEAEFSFLGEAFFDILKNHPGLLTEIFNPVVIHEEGSRRDALKFVDLTFEQFDPTIEGTDAMEVSLPGMAVDLLVSVEGGPFLSVFDGLQEGEEQ
jgi:hypothetical protein